MTPSGSGPTGGTVSGAPFVPPRFLADDPCGGRIGPAPSDFRVDEIPAYPLSGEGEHLFLKVEKVGLNTAEVAQRVARAAGLRERDVGYAGMKDRNAITRQWFSVCCKDENAEAWNLGDGVRILEVTRHKNKLRTGHLTGNRFRIAVVDVPSGGEERVREMADELRRSGLPNYFGSQRFGRGGRNLSEAWAWLNGGERSGKRGRFANKLLPSVLQAEVFNRYTAARLADPTALLEGEVVRLEGSASGFVVEDVAAELLRLKDGEIHRTGPLPGPKARPAGAAALALEERILADVGLTEESRAALGKHAPGTRRDLLVQPEDLEANASDGSLVLEFSLPAGAYATQVVREFCGTDWARPRG
ncbi:MAG: tRNA pseudouridine(13) synthase TruD [Candidatus Binatia bacterium]|nr:tRNA pseudouridine(13) synthase TruD [Candidatus Binatia bacterium]